MTLLSALLLASTAHAADLDLSVQFSDSDAQELTLRDVVGRDLPALLLVDDEGELRHIEISVEELEDGTFEIDANHSRVEEDRRGRLRIEPQPLSVNGEELPSLRVPPNRLATISHGKRIPYMEGDEVKFYERGIKIRLVVRE